MQVDFIDGLIALRANKHLAFVSWNLNQDSSYIDAWSLDLCIFSTI